MKKGISGEGISFMSKGAGRPLIFIHGWAMACTIWESQLDYFSSKGFEAVAPDLRGHGESTTEGPFTISRIADDLHSLICERGYDKPFLVGWSMGAIVLLSYIDKHPRSAEGICLVGGTPRFTKTDGYPYGLDKKDVMGMKVKLKRDFARSLREFRESVSEGLPEDEKRRIVDAAVPSFEAAKEGLDELIVRDLRDRLAGIKVPLLLIHGACDRICPPGASRYMAEKIASAALFELEDAGHAPFLSDKETFHSTLEKFLGSIA